MEGIAQVAGLKKKPAAPAARQREVCTVELDVLQKGSKGASVKAMQLLLIGNGYPCGATGADGDFGANTDAALRAYQKAKGLTADGICGEKTWGKLLGG
jgi:peptidoglycan hydrolase-like protein with peptidoglycan-binding domain